MNATEQEIADKKALASKTTADTKVVAEVPKTDETPANL